MVKCGTTALPSSRLAELFRTKPSTWCSRHFRLSTGTKYPFATLLSARDRNANRFEQLSASMGLQNKITFTGYISDEDKWQLLQASDLYVMPSRVRPEDQHEGFGIAFLEAAACGIPSVGTNAGGIPDAVLDGETGMLVEPDSPEALAQTLTFLYRIPPSASKWEWLQGNGHVRSFPQASSRHSFTKRCHCASRFPVCDAVAS